MTENELNGFQGSDLEPSRFEYVHPGTLQDRQYKLEIEWAPSVTEGPQMVVLTLERGG